MKSDLPKILHSLASRPMLAHVLGGLEQLRPERIVVVSGPGMNSVAEAAAPHDVVVQEDRLGTGHAVKCGRPGLEELISGQDESDVLVVFGDTPLLTVETLQGLRVRREESDHPDLVGLAFRPKDAAQYGRVVIDDTGAVKRIVEFVDANDAEREISLCNAGAVLGEGRVLFDLVDRLSNDNAKGEYYLTDIFALARAAGHRAVMVEGSEEEVLGINSRAELAGAERILQARLRGRAMAEGATLIDPETVWFAWDTKLGRDVTIQPNVFFGPGVVLEDGVEIRGFSHIEGARIAKGGIVGPFARLRPGTDIGEGARIGNFVEVKNATLDAGAKANHLTYVGDSHVGAKANIGAGTITCNYDGFGKHRTEIGAGAFIGSNTALVAPVTIGSGAIVGAGSTVSEDVPGDALAIARGVQRNFEDGAVVFRDKRLKEKAEKGS